MRHFSIPVERIPLRTAGRNQLPNFNWRGHSRNSWHRRSVLPKSKGSQRAPCLGCVVPHVRRCFLLGQPQIRSRTAYRVRSSPEAPIPNGFVTVQTTAVGQEASESSWIPAARVHCKGGQGPGLARGHGDVTSHAVQELKIETSGAGIIPVHFREPWNVKARGSSVNVFTLETSAELPARSFQGLTRRPWFLYRSLCSFMLHDVAAVTSPSFKWWNVLSWWAKEQESAPVLSILPTLPSTWSHLSLAMVPPSRWRPSRELDFINRDFEACSRLAEPRVSVLTPKRMLLHTHCLKQTPS